MTNHYMICTECGYSIESESLDDLFATGRQCPLCNHTRWEIIDSEPFPCREQERKIMYQKILYVLKWCAAEKACITPGKKCPLQKHCKNRNAVDAFMAWLMEAQI